MARIRPTGEGLRQRSPQRKDRPHLDWLKTLPCCVTGQEQAIDPAHVRYADPDYGKRQTGGAEKSDDCYAVPLCRTEHDRQHSMNEQEYWRQVGIDPLLLAVKLFAASGNDAAGRAIIRRIPRGEPKWTN